MRSIMQNNRVDIDDDNDDEDLALYVSAYFTVA